MMVIIIDLGDVAIFMIVHVRLGIHQDQLLIFEP